MTTTIEPPAPWTSERRAFLTHFGSGMLLAALGSVGSRRHAGAALLPYLEDEEGLELGRFAPWVELMTDTPLERLQPRLVQLLREGVAPADLVGAAALANARAFGGQDYTGYHAYMALMPAFEMSRELPPGRAALPVLKVLYRNTARIQAFGGDTAPRLAGAPPAFAGEGAVDADWLVARVRAQDMRAAEAGFDDLVERDPRRAFEELLPAVNQEVDVHRVVLAWRAWDLLRLTGVEHARVLLRQSLRQCVDREASAGQRAIRGELPPLVEASGVMRAPLGERRASDAWIEDFARRAVEADRPGAARMTAEALIEGIDPADVGAAHSLACSLVMLRQPGRQDDGDAAKPRGSVHGAGTGVHASDTAAAWRGIARTGGPDATRLALVSSGYYLGELARHVAREPYLSMDAADELARRPVEEGLGVLAECLRGRDLEGAAAAGHALARREDALRPLADVLLACAVASDGALHAEKYYRTQLEALEGDRPAHRPLHAAALARVSASESGFEAEGRAQALELLGL